MASHYVCTLAANTVRPSQSSLMMGVSRQRRHRGAPYIAYVNGTNSFSSIDPSIHAIDGAWATVPVPFEREALPKDILQYEHILSKLVYVCIRCAGYSIPIAFAVFLSSLDHVLVRYQEMCTCRLSDGVLSVRRSPYGARDGR
jgi:hypothetical protein